MELPDKERRGQLGQTDKGASQATRMHEAGRGESGQSEPRKQKTERRARCVSSHFMSQPASMTEPLVCAPSTGPASHHPHHVSQNLAGFAPKWLGPPSVGALPAAARAQKLAC
ncbi:hypothetical protein I7I51_04090 [Histoplasma capsulatum]|uniref:Uncharacterized protein n=1 Tax=Ajellomyces capsulatus TaxID=5037 RepID=A0A8A1MB14_AJECA|nr:hypothetical protein I7I51_04090 [Histoplasma capsulatum]